jgi:hypothetical protein
VFYPLRPHIVAFCLLTLVGAVAPATAGPVVAREAAPPRRINFTNDILPVLSQTGCNQGSCHGKASGQGGFRLSIFAFDPRADYDAIVKEARGRRVRGSEPDRSLLLLKPTARTPHGGGRRFAVGSPEERLLRRWIAAGMPFGDARDPVLERVEISPLERVLGMKQTQQLRVTAVFSDGSCRDVTRAAAYSSNEDQIASVAPGGLVRTAGVAGEAAVMVRYMGQIAVSRVTVPYGHPAGGGSGRWALRSGLDGSRKGRRIDSRPRGAAHREPGARSRERSEHHRRSGPEKAGAAGDPLLASLHGCGICAPGVSGRHRHAAHARGDTGVSGRYRSAPARKTRRDAVGAAGVRRLLGDAVVRHPSGQPGSSLPQGRLGL